MSLNTPHGHVMLLTTDPEVVEQLDAPLRAEGHETTVSYSPLSARSSLKLCPVDLIVLDLESLRWPGMTFLGWLRERSGSASTPVIFLAGASERGYIVAGLRAGANHVMTKPVSVSAMMACVQVLLRESAEKTSRKTIALSDVKATLAKRSQQSGRAQRAGSISGHVRRVKERQKSGATPSTKPYPRWRPPTVRGEPGPPDTSDLVTVDWILFRAIQTSLSRCVEDESHLAVLMIEGEPLDGIDAGLLGAFSSAFEREIRLAISPRQALEQVEGPTFMALIRGADERAAIHIAQAIRRRIHDASLWVGGNLCRANAYVGLFSTFGPSFKGSPFQLVDWTKEALRTAKSSGTCGWWVVHEEGRTAELEESGAFTAIRRITD